MAVAVGAVAVHDVGVEVVGEVADVRPGHVSGLAHQELADLRLEAVDEVEAEVCCVAVGQVSDDALKLVGVGLD